MRLVYQVDVIPNQPPTITAQTGGAYSVSENDNAQTELEAFTVTDPEGDGFSCIIASLTPPVTGTFGLWTDPSKLVVNSAIIRITCPENLMKNLIPLEYFFARKLFRSSNLTKVFCLRNSFFKQIYLSFDFSQIS